MVELITFVIAGAVVLGGAVGVVLSENPVHAALSLVATLFGVAVLFIAQDAHFLAAVQVIVYAGAIVVLFLFVIMLLGVSGVDDLRTEPLAGQRPAAVVAGVGVLGLSLVALFAAGGITGADGAVAPTEEGTPNINQLARVLFTDYVFAFEITAILLTISVVGAVILARRVPPSENASDHADASDASDADEADEADDSPGAVEPASSPRAEAP